MRRLFFYSMVAMFGLVTINSCKCSSNTSKTDIIPESAVEEVAELLPGNTTIGQWVTKIARDDSSITLLYSKDQKQFFIHDELRNTTGIYYDKLSPVAVSLQDDGCYYITYQNGIKDCYYLNPENGRINWQCEGYAPETINANSFNAKMFRFALDDRQ